MFGEDGNKDSLTLKNIKADAFGKYTCEARNELGMDHSSIEVSGMAAIIR